MPIVLALSLVMALGVFLDVKGRKGKGTKDRSVTLRRCTVGGGCMIALSVVMVVGAFLGVG